jgi:copper transport protein
MLRSTTHRLLLLALVVGGALATLLGVSPGSVLAHNSLVSSNPADGATLTVAPTQIMWVFDKSVPLDTLTVTLIDASGARSELAGSVHGAAGDTEVVTPLPVLQPGAVSVRWRLVGPDGHPVTGRVDITIEQPAVSAAPDVVAPAPAGGDTAPSTSISPAAEPTADDGGDDASSTPSLVRWLLRYSSYLAIMAVVGILLTSAYVWAGAGTHPLLRQILSAALIATAVLAFLQLLVIGSDISGEMLWASFGSFDAALSTDAGMALAIRIVIAIAMWLVLFQYRIDHPDVYWTTAALPGLGLLATWAFAGHSSSMRWPEIGVITDVVHHAAAAAWIGGLAIVGWIVIPTATPDVLVTAVRRFSRVAAVSVAVLVVTGLIQTVRLVGNPTNLLDADHGRYLVAKLVVLAVMLAIANVNRRRIDSRLDDPSTVNRHLGSIRKAVVAEFAIGLAIIAITAAMVVSPPSTSESATSATPAESTDVYYMV